MEILNISRDDCIYTSCYCEENIWKLCEKVKKCSNLDILQFHVVFISNPEKQIPLWCQKSSRYPLSEPVVWDYHVLLTYNKGNNFLVYDLDTILNFPCDLQEYAIKALRSEKDFKKNFCRMFRVIPAQTYLDVFASDRSHMLTMEGKWRSPPPEYLPISTKDCTMNLFDFIDMSASEGPGKVLNLENFLKYFQCEMIK